MQQDSDWLIAMPSREDKASQRLDDVTEEWLCFRQIKSHWNRKIRTSTVSSDLIHICLSRARGVASSWLLVIRKLQK